MALHCKLVVLLCIPSHLWTGHQQSFPLPSCSTTNNNTMPPSCNFYSFTPLAPLSCNGHRSLSSLPYQPQFIASLAGSGNHRRGWRWRGSRCRCHSSQWRGGRRWEALHWCWMALGSPRSLFHLIHFFSFFFFFNFLGEWVGLVVVVEEVHFWQEYYGKITMWLLYCCWQWSSVGTRAQCSPTMRLATM